MKSHLSQASAALAAVTTTHSVFVDPGMAAARARPAASRWCRSALLRLLIVVPGLAGMTDAMAQLAAGDLVTVCWNSDGDDDFAVIALANIPGSTRFFLADSGWSANSGNLAPESSSPFWQRQIQFDVAAAGIPFGTVIEFDQAGSNAVLVNPALGTLTAVARHIPTSAVNTHLSFGSTGDQLLIYQIAGSITTGTATMISGFNGSAYTNPPGITVTNGWQVGLLPQTGQDGTTSESNAPGTLVVYNGSNASTATALGLASLSVSGLTAVDNYKYVGSVALPTKTAFLTSINNPANWSANDTVVFGCAFGAAAFPEIAVTGNGNNIADGDITPSLTDHTDFGDADTATATVTRTYTINNSGSGSLSVGAITFSGPQAGDFSVASSPASTVGPSGSTTFQILFNPTATGFRNAIVSVVNGDSDEGPFDFAILGNGTAPEINVTGNGTTISDGDMTPSLSDHTDFGDSDVAAGTVVRTFTIANSGSGAGALTLGTVTIGGTHAADFSVTTVPNSPVISGSSTTFQVTFNPSANGARSATLSFSNNDSDEDPYNYAILGTGTAPEIQVFTGASTAPGDERTDNVGTHAFADTNVGASSAAQTFTIKNAGLGTLASLALSKTGSHTGDFTLGALGSSILAAGATTTFTVTFAPTAAGARSAVVNIASNDGDENPFRINVGGTGRSADVQVSKTNFESVLQPGQDTLYTIQARNAGPSSVGSISITDTLPGALLNAQWTCTSAPPALCPNASGSGNINQTTGVLPNNALLEYHLIATVSGSPGAFITNTVIVINNDGSDGSAGNNSATDTDPVITDGIFINGFENTGLALLVPPMEG